MKAKTEPPKSANKNARPMFFRQQVVSRLEKNMQKNIPMKCFPPQNPSHSWHVVPLIDYACHILLILATLATQKATRPVVTPQTSFSSMVPQ